MSPTMPHCRGNMYAELLLSNDKKDAKTAPQTHFYCCMYLLPWQCYLAMKGGDARAHTRKTKQTDLGGGGGYLGSLKSMGTHGLRKK
jgi:hypothetical protein